MRFGEEIVGIHGSRQHGRKTSCGLIGFHCGGKDNEVCVDMNAPLVGALGYILSKKAPVTMPGEEEKPDTVDVVPVVAKAPDFSLVQNGSTITLSGMDASAFDVQVFDLAGKMVEQFKGLQGTATLSLRAKGVLQVRVISAKSRHTFMVKSL
jgi:hypothetical protein